MLFYSQSLVVIHLHVAHVLLLWIKLVIPEQWTPSEQEWRNGQAKHVSGSRRGQMNELMPTSNLALGNELFKILTALARWP